MLINRHLTVKQTRLLESETWDGLALLHPTKHLSAEGSKSTNRAQVPFL